MILFVKKLAYFIRKFSFILLVFIPVAAGIAYCFIFYKPDLSIVPVSGYEINAYTDTPFKGNSEVKLFHSDGQGVRLEYLLHPAYANPYAGVWIQLAKDRYLDLRGYDIMQVSLKDTGSGNIWFQLLAFDRNVTKRENILSYAFYQKECFFDKTNERYIFPLKEFLIPPWWISRFHIQGASFVPRDFSKVLALEIESGINSPIGTEAGFIIRELSFKQNRLIFFFRLFSGLALYFLVISAYRFFTGKKKAGVVVIPYEKLKVDNLSDTEKDRITSFIAEHFSQPDLSLEKIAGEIGIHSNRIGGILKKNFKMGFKGYLNRVRIAEAKRLLLSSDRSIAEISFAVGFNNPTHFNRIFKKDEKISPKEFQKKNLKD